MDTLTAPSRALDQLRALAKPKPKKDDHAALDPAGEAKSKFQELANAKRALKDAEALVKSLQADCVAIAEPERVKLSRAQGKCLSSLNLGMLMYIHQNRYSAIKDLSSDEENPGPTLEQREVELRGIFGDDFGLYFLEQMQISVEVSKLTPEQISALAEMDPEVERTFKVTSSLHNDRTLRQGVLEKCETANLKPVSYFKKA